MQAHAEQVRRGVVEYRGDAGLRGRETFSVSRSPDGTMTLQAHCRMFDTQVERWVVHTVDGALRPLRSYVSQRRAGEFLGEGRFVVEADAVIASTRVAGLGDLEQRVSVDGPLDYFVPHAVAADSWITPHHPSDEPGWREVLRGYTTSLLPDGSTGPLIERHGGLRLRLEGSGAIEVPAGTFEVDHFVVSARPGIEEHLWVTSDHWATLVKLRSDRLATTYVLTELTEEPMWPSPSS